MEERIGEAEGLRSLFNQDELEVCEILQDLRNLIVESESRLRTITTPPKPFLVRWGTQKRLICRGGTRRGSTGLSPPDNTATTAALSKYPSPLPSLPNNTSSQREVKVVGSTSPDTPLSFSANASSESDEKSCRRKNSKKRVLIEELRKSTEVLSERREVLTKEIENVKSGYNELLAYNAKLKAELKAKKQQMVATNTCHTREEPNLELNNSLNPISNCLQSCQIPVIANQNQVHGPQLAMESGRPGVYPYGNGQVQVRLNSLSSSSTELGKVNPTSPPDNSNLKAAAATYGMASSQPLNYCCRALADNNRSKAAEARRNRKMINRQKSVLRQKLKGISRIVMISHH